VDCIVSLQPFLYLFDAKTTTVEQIVAKMTD